MWFIIALIVGGLAAWLVMWLRSRDVKVAWYEYLIGAIGVVLLLLTAGFFLGAQAEWESTAAYMSLAVLGIPALILMAVAWQLASRRSRASS